MVQIMSLIQRIARGQGVNETKQLHYEIEVIVFPLTITAFCLSAHTIRV